MNGVSTPAASVTLSWRARPRRRTECEPSNVASICAPSLACQTKDAGSASHWVWTASSSRTGRSSTTGCMPLTWETRWISSAVVCRPHDRGQVQPRAPYRERNLTDVEGCAAVASSAVGRWAFVWAVNGSVLHGAGGDTGGDVALGHDDEQCGRDGGENSGGHHRAPLLVLGADVVVDPHRDRAAVDRPRG